MTIVLILFVVLLVLAVATLYSRVALPKNVDAIISEIKQEGIPEFIVGETGMANNNGVDIAYEIINGNENNGQTVLLINGHSHWQLTIPAHFYQPFVEAGYQLVKFDNRGLGASDWITDWQKSSPYNLEDMAADSIAVLDHLKIEQAHLIGISMGGMIAQSMAINHPQYVASLTSIMSTGFWADPKLTAVPKGWYINFLAVNFLYGKKLLRPEDRAKFFLAHQRYLRGKGDYIFNDKELLQKALYEFGHRKGLNPKAGEQHTYAIIKSGSRYEKLGAITAPTLVIHGTDDPLIKVEHAEKYAAMIPNAKKIILKGMGHDLPAIYMPEIHQEIFETLNQVTANK